MEREHVIAIDVGGRVFKVLRPTIMKFPEGTLAQVLQGKDLHNLVIIDHTYFFDRNPDYFAVVLDYMRNGKLFLPPNLSPEQMAAEAQFWKMNGITAELRGTAPRGKLPDTPVLEATPPLDPVPAPPQIVPTLVLAEPTKQLTGTPPLPGSPAQQYQPSLVLTDPPQYAPTLLLEEPRKQQPAQNYAATLLLDDPKPQNYLAKRLEEPKRDALAAPNYAATLLLNDPQPAKPPSQAAPNFAATLLLEDPKPAKPYSQNAMPPPNYAATLLLEEPKPVAQVPNYAATLLLGDAPPSPTMAPEKKDAAFAPTLLLEEPPRASPRKPQQATPPVAFQGTLLLPRDEPGTPELPSTPKLSDDEAKPKVEARGRARDSPKAKQEKKVEDDLLGSLVKAQDLAPARALPFGGGAKPAKKAKREPAAGKYKRRRDSSSEGSLALDESYESSFIDDDSVDDDDGEEYKPKKKAKGGGGKTKTKPKKRRGSEEIPMKQPNTVVLLSGFQEKERTAMEKLVAHLGGTVAEDFDQVPTHLVMPEFKRNIKVLTAICQGIPLTKATWLQESQRQNKWLDSAAYPLCTPAVEAAHRFRYQDTVRKAGAQKLLEGYTVWFSPSVNPSADELGGVVRAAGGKVIAKRPTKLSNTTLLIVGDEEKPKDMQGLVKLGFKLYSVELLCQGVLAQELDLNNHFKRV